jgi:hypothetical protein
MSAPRAAAGSTTATAPHLLVQRHLVRMYFDPDFARAAQERPDEVLAELPEALRRQLAAVDLRALRLDRLRRRRALRTLADEWKGTTTWLLAATGQLALLDAFFSSAEFHASVLERGSMPMAFAAYLGRLIVERGMDVPHLPGVLAIETAVARARREDELLARRRAAARPGAAEAGVPGGALPVASIGAPTEEPHLARALGVLPLVIEAGALAALHAAEQYLFEVGLMPAVALCDDAPTLTLDPALVDRTPHPLTVVVLEGQVSLVSVEPELAAVLVSAGPSPRSARAIVDEAVARGLSRAAAEEALRQALESELLVPAASPSAATS